MLGLALSFLNILFILAALFEFAAPDVCSPLRLHVYMPSNHRG